MTTLDLTQFRLAQNSVSEGHPFWFCNIHITSDHEIEMGLYGTEKSPDPQALEQALACLAKLSHLEQQALLTLGIFREKNAEWWLGGLEIYAPQRDPLGAEYSLMYTREDMPAAGDSIAYYVGFIQEHPKYAVFRYE